MLKITPIGKSAEEGVTANYMGVDLLIARAGNTKFKAAFRRLTKPYKHDIDNSTLSDEISEKLLAEAMAEGVLVGWSGFKSDGKEVKYSVDNAVDLLMNDPDCMEFVSEFSRDINNYLEKDKAELVGK
jgi:hypothetical protein